VGQVRAQADKGLGSEEAKALLGEARKIQEEIGCE
jgi:hypothetical protein